MVHTVTRWPRGVEKAGTTIPVDLEDTKIHISALQVGEEKQIGEDRVVGDFPEEVGGIVFEEAKKGQEDVTRVIDRLFQRHRIKETFQRFACTGLHFIIIFLYHLLTPCHNTVAHNDHTDIDKHNHCTDTSMRALGVR